MESLTHLFTNFPLTILVWANSPWQLQVEHLSQPSLEAWIASILQPQADLTPSGPDKEEVLHFVVVAFENVWRARNEARLYGTCEDWDRI